MPGLTSLGLNAAAILQAIEAPRLTAPGLFAAAEAIRTMGAARLDVTKMLGGATAHLIDGWRSQLLRGADTRLAVANSMSNVIAESNLGLLTARTFAPVFAGAALRNAIEQASASYLSGVGLAIRESVIDSLRPTALLATNTLLARMQAQDEHHRRCDEALWKMGWWFPPSAPMSWFWRVGNLAIKGDRIAVRHAMVDAGRSRWLRGTIEEWMQLEPFRERRRFILDGFKQHRLGGFRISIPVLLPHIEGIAMDAFEPGSAATNPKNAVATAATIATVMGPAVVETVTVLWANRTFSEVPAGSRQLNRHLILHGHSTGFGTAENSVKTLFALDLLAAVIQEAEEEASRATAPKADHLNSIPSTRRRC